MAEHQYTQQPQKKDNTSQKQTTPPKQIPLSHPAAIIQRARINPKSLTHADVMQLQLAIGNRAVGKLLSEIGLIPSTAKPIQRQEIPKEEEICPSCVQRQEIPKEEEPLQGKMIKTIQCQEIPEEEEPLQGKMIETIQLQEVPEEEPLQTNKVNNTGLPDNLKAGVETLSGLDMSDVRVHYNSSKPAEVGALAYTQGTNIHVAPGQERHLPHETWHVVQQVQGIVKPTMQIRGVAVNNDAGLEHEADMMGEKALHVGVDALPILLNSKSTMSLQLINKASNFPVQLNRGKTTGGIIAGASIGGAIGAGLGAMLGIAVPGAGIIAGGIAGGFIGSLIGANLGYFFSKPELYKNVYLLNQYRDELATFQSYKTQMANAANDYLKGTIITYNSTNSIAFNNLLHLGKVLYTYDEDSELKICGDVGDVKHAIVAGNKDVKAAGMANVIKTEPEKNMADYKHAMAIVKESVLILSETRDKAEQIIKKFITREPSKIKEVKPAFYLDLAIRDEKTESSEKEILIRFKDSRDNIGYYQSEIERLQSSDRKDQEFSKNNLVNIDNKSGHYKPKPKSKEEAYEAWHNAGYNNLRWEQLE